MSTLTSPLARFLLTAPQSVLPAFCTLCFLSSPIQVNLPIVYLMKGTTVFFFFTYSRLTVLLQQHSFGPYKDIIQRVQGALERCLAGDLL